MGKRWKMLHISGPDHVVITPSGYRFEFHHYLGPTMLDQHDNPLPPPGPRHGFWTAFTRWFNEHKTTCVRCRATEEAPDAE